MKNFYILLISAIIFGGCSTLRVQVDYDPEFDFNTTSTFSVVYAKKSDTRDLARSRIARALEHYMENKGYKSIKDKSKADLYFILHFDVQTKQEVETNYVNMGINPQLDIYGLPYALSQTDEDYRAAVMQNAIEPDIRATTRTYEYDESKLIIEVLDVKSNAVVWQGVAKDEISNSYNHEEMSLYIDNIIKRLFGGFNAKR